jgi:hypothetical protein
MNTRAARLIITLTAPLLAAGVLFLLWLSPARADDPCDLDFTTADWVEVSHTAGGTFSRSGSTTHLDDTEYWLSESEAYFSLPVTLTVQEGDYVTVTHQVQTPNVWADLLIRVRLTAIYSDSSTVDTGFLDITNSNYPTGTFNLSLWLKAGDLSSLRVDHYFDSVWPGDSSLEIVSTELSGCSSPPVGGDSCPTVQNSHFAISDTTWLLDGTAAIDPVSSTLTLAPGDIAAQNLTLLESNKTYDAVISVTQVTAPSSLNVVLGTQSETIDISTPDWYTATLTTPQLGGPIAYALQNEGDGTLTIDFTCVTLAITGTDGETQQGCIAPTNGAFDTSAGWDWYREATWNEAAENAYLPFNQGDEYAKSLIMSTSLYTMPVITAGNYLLLAFDAETENDQSAVIAATVDNGPDSSAGYFEIFPDIYTFELDLTTAMSGTTGAAVAFANAGTDPITEFSAEDNIFLDNVCIFVSDRGPRLPAPTDSDPGGIGPIGFNYKLGCADAAAILAYWGINMNLYHAIYGGSGTSQGWFQSWWDWLSAGFWVMLESLLCFLLVALGWVINIIEYGINNFLNVAGWIVREGRYLLTFIGALWAWGLATVGNLMAWWRISAGSVVAWLWQSGLNLLAFLGTLYNGLVEIENSLLAWLAPIFQAILYFIAPLAFFANFAAAVWDLFVMLFTWIWVNVFVMVNIPIRFYYAFNDGVQTEAFSNLMSCAGTNFWCGLLAGVQLVNQTVGHTVLYPIVIVGIILTTVAIFWKHIWALFSINIR